MDSEPGYVINASFGSVLGVSNNCLLFYVESMSSTQLAWIIGGSVVCAILLIVVVTLIAILVKKYVYDASSKVTGDDSKSY